MGEIDIEWQGHDKAMSTKLWEFLKEGYLVDFNVYCHGNHMKVHKLVLAMLFPILKESLKPSGTFPLNHGEQTREGPIKTSMLTTPLCLNLDNIADHAEDMNHLIQFAYTGKVTVSKEHLDCLLRIANNMDIKSLKESLKKWQDPKENKVMPETRLRPRPLIKKVIEESKDDAVPSDVESNMSNSFKCSDSSSNDCKTISRFKKKRTKMMLPRKRQRAVVQSKEKSDETQNSTESTQESKDEANGEINSTGQATTSNDDTLKEKKSVQCPECHYVAKFPCLLKRHLKTHSNSEHAFVCKYCEHTTNSKNAFHEHIMAKHQVDAQGNPLEKNVKCPDCDYVCYARHQLKYHSRTKHQHLGKFKCKECNYAAPYINQLRRHERMKHQNEKDYMCETCGNRYQRRAQLNRHVSIQHKGEKPFKCQICNAAYSDSLSFKIHVQRHEGKVEYTFVCHICGHNLRRKNELRIHMRKKHGTELEERLEPTDDLDPCQSEGVVEPTS